MATLAQVRKDDQIGRDPQRETPAWGKRQRQLYQHDWVVYAKTPSAGPAQSLPPAKAGVLTYLSRYTHRTAIGNQRIRASRAAKAWPSRCAPTSTAASDWCAWKASGSSAAFCCTCCPRVQTHSPLRGIGIKLQGSQVGTGASGFDQTLAGPRQLPTAGSTVLPQVSTGKSPAMKGNGRIGGSAFTARSGGPGCAAGAASAKRQAARANRPGQGIYAQKIARPPVPAQLWLANGAGASP